MHVAGIVSEYNPFHNGHQYQIEQTKAIGATHVVAVMSGDFVQRGDAACFDKFTRAKSALENGVDLVVELPVEFCLSSANIFARSSVYILSQLSIDILSFGSECGNIDKLSSLAQMCDKISNCDEMRAELKKGVSYPTAQTNVIATLFGESYSDIITHPNNLLAVEYIRAINEFNPNIKPVTIARTGASHDTDTHSKTIASASYIRSELTADMLKQFTPKSALQIYNNAIQSNLSPINTDLLNSLIMYKLRTMSKDDIALLPDVSEGLQNRIYDAVKTSTSLDELLGKIKTKRYTLARIRRIMFCALLNIYKEHQSVLPQYIRVLGANKKGMEILKRSKATAILPISPKFANLAKLDKTNINLTSTAGDIYSLLLPSVQTASRDYTQNCIILD